MGGIQVKQLREFSGHTHCRHMSLLHLHRRCQSFLHLHHRSLSFQCLHRQRLSFLRLHCQRLSFLRMHHQHLSFLRRRLSLLQSFLPLRQHYSFACSVLSCRGCTCFESNEGRHYGSCSCLFFSFCFCFSLILSYRSFFTPAPMLVSRFLWY